jgi:hypothetical protein
MNPAWFCFVREARPAQGIAQACRPSSDVSGAQSTCVGMVSVKIETYASRQLTLVVGVYYRPLRLGLRAVLY